MDPSSQEDAERRQSSPLADSEHPEERDIPQEEIGDAGGAHDGEEEHPEDRRTTSLDKATNDHGEANDLLAEAESHKEEDLEGDELHKGLPGAQAEARNARISRWSLQKKPGAKNTGTATPGAVRVPADVDAEESIEGITPFSSRFDHEEKESTPAASQAAHSRSVRPSRRKGQDAEAATPYAQRGESNTKPGAVYVPLPADTEEEHGVDQNGSASRFRGGDLDEGNHTIESHQRRSSANRRSSAKRRSIRDQSAAATTHADAASMPRNDPNEVADGNHMDIGAISSSVSAYARSARKSRLISSSAAAKEDSLHKGSGEEDAKPGAVYIPRSADLDDDDGDEGAAGAALPRRRRSSATLRSPAKRRSIRDQTVVEASHPDAAPDINITERNCCDSEGNEHYDSNKTFEHGNNDWDMDEEDKPPFSQNMPVGNNLEGLLESGIQLQHRPSNGNIANREDHSGSMTNWRYDLADPHLYDDVLNQQTGTVALNTESDDVSRRSVLSNGTAEDEHEEDLHLLDIRNSQLSTFPGAVEIEPDALSLGNYHEREADDDDEEQGRHIASNPEDANVESLSEPVAIDAQLASDDSREGADDLLLVDAKIEPKSDGGIARQRKRLLIFGFVFLIVITIVTVVGAVLGTRTSKRDLDVSVLTFQPTGAPTSVETADEAMRTFLANLTVGYGSPFEPGTPHAMAVDWIMYEDPLRVRSLSGRLVQRYAMGLFYLQTTRKGTGLWKRCNPAVGNEDKTICLDFQGGSANRWMSGSDECTWYGITCSPSGEVIAFFLEKMNLVGTIPSSLFLVSRLEYLHLPSNKLSGPIPEKLYDFTNLLGIQLLGNQLLASTIPTQLGLLTNLLLLSFDNGAIKGTIPSEIGKASKLQSFLVEFSELTGTIPDELFKLTDLQFFELVGGSLSGTLSTCIGLLSNLQYFSLNWNMLSGEFPTEVGKCTSLIHFQASDNLLSGHIPSEIGALTVLEILALGPNKFTGTLPEEAFNATALLYFSLVNSTIEGTISTRIGHLTNMLQFWAHGNQLSGTIPSEIGILSPKFNAISLHSNLLTGTLPEELFELAGLDILYACHNGFTGTLSTRMGLLTGMIDLSFAANRFRGSLPSELGNMSSLKFLDLEKSPEIIGEIPEELFNLTKLEMIKFGKMGLTGTLSANFGRLSALSYADIMHNPITGSIPSQIGSIAALGHFLISNTTLVGSVPLEMCKLRKSGNLKFLQTDCLPVDNPPVSCACCTACCNRESGECLDN